MKEKPINLQMEYTADEDPDCTWIATDAVPKPGDLIRTGERMYQVEKIVFDDINSEMGCQITAIVSPSQYQMPSASPKVTT